MTNHHDIDTHDDPERDALMERYKDAIVERYEGLFCFNCGEQSGETDLCVPCALRSMKREPYSWEAE